jgi:carotenoid cleavage dioxygenase-like enzyme
MRYSPSLVHDLGITARSYIVVEPPLKAKLGKLLYGAKSAWSCFETVKDAPVLVTIAPRAVGGTAKTVPLPAWVRMAFHIVNAFDDGAHTVVDLLVYDAPIDFISSCPAALRERDHFGTPGDARGVVVRYRIDVESGAVTEQKISDWGEQPDVPIAVNGKPYRFGYMREPMHERPPTVAAEILWWHGVKKIDFTSGVPVPVPVIDRYGAGEGRFVGPPAFAPRVGARSEDDGYVLLWVVDGDARSEVLILDAQKLAAGPMCTLKLPCFVPPPGHAAFSDTVDIFPSS